MHLTVSFQLISYPGVKNKFMLVNLDGTTVSPGVLVNNNGLTRGWYLDKITVEMYIEEPHASRFVLRKDSPQGKNGSANTSSSISDTIGIQGGVFADNPMAMGNFSETITSSFNHNLEDFKIVNQSNVVKNDHVLHIYKMSGCSNGAYNGHHDLVNESAVSFVNVSQQLNWSDVVNAAIAGGVAAGVAVGVVAARTKAILKNGVLYDLPDLATSKFPIISQGLWMTSDDEDFRDVPTFRIVITQYVSRVSGYLHGDTPDGHYQGWKKSYILSTPIDFAQV